jgi:hypothetical protein
MKALLITFLLMVTQCICVQAQTPTPNIANGQIVCVGEDKFYGDSPLNPTSTYLFTITPAQAFIIIGQQIEVIWSTSGVYTMTMTETNLAGCQFTTTATITVKPNVLASITNSTICEDSPCFPITGLNLGSNPVFSGVGVVGNTFCPNGLTPGSYVINVTGNTANGCPINGTGTITIAPLPTGVINTN